MEKVGGFIFYRNRDEPERVKECVCDCVCFPAEALAKDSFVA